MKEIEILNSIFDYLVNNNLIRNQREFAKLIGETDSGYSDMKHGRKKLSLSHIRAIAKNFKQINRDYLLLGKGEIENSIQNNSDPLIEDKEFSSLVDSQRITIDCLKETNELLKEKIIRLESSLKQYTDLEH